jgi:hypothetical protein
VPPEPPPPAPETPPDRPGESGQAPEVKAREAVSEASTITLLLLLDKSPSMRGEKLRLAIEGARAAAATLAPTDRVGVLAFDDEPRWIVALGTLGDGGQFRSGVEKVQVESGTGTLFLPALNEAHRALKAERSRIRHLVLITDGDSSETEPTRIHRFRTLAGAMARDKITISTIGISIGSFNSSFLGSLVIWNRGPGRGGFTFTDNTNEIPQLLTAEADWALEAAGRRAPGGKEVPLPPGEGPVREPRPGPAPAPPTGPERPAETATPRAEEERPPSAEPTPPATGTPHAVELRARAPFFRGLTAPPFPPVVKWETASARRAAWVLLDVEGRDPLLAYRPYGKGKVLALATGIDDAAAPEWARWPELPALAAQAVRWLAPPPPAAIPRRVPPVHGPELAHTATDAVALERLARLTGGRVLSPAEPTPLPEGRPVERSAPLTLPCLGVAAALLVLDLLARRLG